MTNEAKTHHLHTIACAWPGAWRNGTDIGGSWVLDILPVGVSFRLVPLEQVVVYPPNGDDLWCVELRRSGINGIYAHDLANGEDLADTVTHARATLRTALEQALKVVG